MQNSYIYSDIDKFLDSGYSMIIAAAESIIPADSASASTASSALGGEVQSTSRFAGAANTFGDRHAPPLTNPKDSLAQYGPPGPFLRHAAMPSKKIPSGMASSQPYEPVQQRNATAKQDSTWADKALAERAVLTQEGDITGATAGISPERGRPRRL